MLFFFFPKKWRHRFKYGRPIAWLINLIFFLALSFTLFTIGFRWAEKSSWGEAGWQAWQTITTVGYGNAPAQSCKGRWVVILAGSIGIVFLGSIVSAVIDVKMDRIHRRRTGAMNNPFKGGYVIFNLPETTLFLTFVNELRALEEDVPFCIVDNRIEELPPLVASLSNVHFIKGSLLDQSTYERARLKDSKAVVVFPLDSDNPDVDGTTKATLDCVEHFITDSTRVLYVLVSENNKWLFREVKATAINESIEVLALVQECQDQYTAASVQRLLSNKEGANPKTVRPKRIVGWSWGDLVDHMGVAARACNIRINLFALIHEGKPQLCPPYDYVIEEGDFIQVVSHSGFDWDAFEYAMMIGK